MRWRWLALLGVALCASACEDNAEMAGTCVELVSSCGDSLVYEKCQKTCNKCPAPAPAPAPAAVNCVGSYGAWGACSKTCGAGTQTASYTATTAAANGGTACPAATKSQACTVKACPVTSMLPPATGEVCFDGAKDTSTRASRT